MVSPPRQKIFVLASQLWETRHRPAERLVRLRCGSSCDFHCWSQAKRLERNGHCNQGDDRHRHDRPDPFQGHAVGGGTEYCAPASPNSTV